MLFIRYTQDDLHDGSHLVPGYKALEFPYKEAEMTSSRKIREKDEKNNVTPIIVPC